MPEARLTQAGCTDTDVRAGWTGLLERCEATESRNPAGSQISSDIKQMTQHQLNVLVRFALHYPTTELIPGMIIRPRALRGQLLNEERYFKLLAIPCRIYTQTFTPITKPLPLLW